VDAFEGTRNNGAGVAGRDSGVVKGRADFESRGSGLVWKVGTDGDFGRRGPLVEWLFRVGSDVSVVLRLLFCGLECEGVALEWLCSRAG
jgi:hypothetical protein